MIHITKITGESYDLLSGEELPKAIVLSNGLREIAIHVPDEVIEQVLLMEQEAARDENDTEARAELASIRPEIQSMPAPQLPMQTAQPKDVGVVKFRPVRNAEIKEPDGYDMVDNEDDATPGEEYNDPSTGVASI